jgi:hypothetical protein
MYTYTNRAGAEMIIDEKRKVEFNGKTYTTWHGSPFDRGSADSWYHRGAVPHWYPQGTGRGERLTADQMSLEEIADYHAGYAHNEECGGKKEW